MDPDAALASLRRFVSSARFAHDELRTVDPEEVQVAADEIEALDAWLSKGGHLPDAWVRRAIEVPVDRVPEAFKGVLIKRGSKTFQAVERPRRKR